MKLESLVFAIAGTCFGLIVGWILGSQLREDPRVAGTSSPAQQTASTSQTPGDAGAGQPIELDETKARTLRQAVERDPNNRTARVQLANLYFDAERYDDATRWYEEALKLEPRDPDVSTDLGVSYYYLNQPDRALKQFDHSLSVNPTHAKTILNQGIVRAFGKQDLEGAAASWRRVIELAPGSPEAMAAQRALDSMKAAHPGLGETSGGSPGGND